MVWKAARAAAAAANTITGTLVAGRVTLSAGANAVTDDPGLTYAANVLIVGSGISTSILRGASNSTLVASAPGAEVNQVWNNAAVAFTGLKANFTVTASNNSGLFLDLQRSGNSAFQVTEFGESKQNQVTIGNSTFSQVFGQLGQNSWLMNSGVELAWSNSATGIGTKSAGLAQNAAGVVEINNGTAGTFADIKIRQLVVDGTITAAGQTGPKTINKGSGSIRIAAAGTTVTLTNSLITANTIVQATLATVDTTAKSVVAVPGAGSAAFTLGAAATGEVEIRWSLVQSA